MYIFKIHGKDYKVRFTYRAICRGDILDKFTKASDFADVNTASGMINQLVTATIEVLIAGLQKYHSKEFGYESEEEYNALIEKFLDLLDDYEEESTEEHPQSAFTLFQDLQGELEKNGFLSAMVRDVAAMEEETEKAEAIKEEMEKEPARTRAIDMTPTESKS